MDVFFDTNKRFKAEPEEVFIVEDECVEEASEIAPNEDSTFVYECTPTTSTFVPHHRDVPAILDGQFFEIVTVNENTCTALCKLCEPRRKTINGSLKATGNFYDHIKRMHISYMAEAETKRGAKRKPRSKKFDPTTLMIDSNSSLPTTMFFPHQQESCSEEQAFSAIFRFVWDTMQPPSIVDMESFRSMVGVLSKNNAIKITCPTSQNIHSALHNSMYSVRSVTEFRLKDVEYVCATADLWKQEDRTFVSITGHAIDPSTFRRESFALGFRLVKTDCKTDFSKEIKDVLNKYNIQKKVQEIVTENISTRTVDSSFDESADLEVNHFRSFSRRLDLVVTFDVTSEAVQQKHLPGDVSGDKSREYSKVYDSVMAKLSGFWSYLKTSPRASTFCQQFCGKILPVPTDEWTSIFEAIKVISETENLHKIFNQLQLVPLETEEMDFLREYVTVLNPFAIAFDILKDTGSFRGVLLPTILSIICRLKVMSLLHFGECLRVLALRGLNERFEMLDYMSDTGFSSLMATISHPAFKMSCLPAELQKSARDVFLGACSTLCDKIYTPKTAESTKKDSFFSVLKSPTASVDCISNEALRYLTDDSEDLAMLHRYPCVKNIFLKYNTCLSSSAPVEQLLAPCRQVFCASKPPHNISDELFEDYLLLKIHTNKHAKIYSVAVN